MYFNKKHDIKIHIRGGWLTTINGGTMFTSDNGSYVFFQGIRFTTSFALHNSAYQIFGYIHISRRWLENGFSLNHFAHEYGHYLQQKDKGLLRYLFFIAIPSLFSALKELSGYLVGIRKKTSDSEQKEFHVRYPASLPRTVLS